MSNTNIAISITVNGERYDVNVPSHQTLLEFLRDTLELTGSKKCCGVGECGACTVLLDGRAVNSCLVFAVETDGSEVLTVEGLANQDGGPALQKAFLDHGAVQCGFCTPGMLMAAHHLLSSSSSPSADEIREGLSGNLCRCTGYNKIVEAVQDAAERRRE